MLASDVVTAARLQHPALSKKTTPDTVALSLLDNIHRRTYMRAIAIRPDRFLAEQVIALPWADFSAGVAVEADFIKVQAGTLQPAGTDLQERCMVAPWGHRHNSMFPAVVVVGDSYRPLGEVGDWEGWDQLTMTYLPAPVSVIALDTVLDLPDHAEDALCASLAAAMSRRAPGAKDVRRELQEVAGGSLRLFYDTIGQEKRAVETRIREVW